MAGWEPEWSVPLPLVRAKNTYVRTLVVMHKMYMVFPSSCRMYEVDPNVANGDGLSTRVIEMPFGRPYYPAVFSSNTAVYMCTKISDGFIFRYDVLRGEWEHIKVAPTCDVIRAHAVTWIPPFTNQRHRSNRSQSEAKAGQGPAWPDGKYAGLSRALRSGNEVMILTGGAAFSDDHGVPQVRYSEECWYLARPISAQNEPANGVALRWEPAPPLSRRRVGHSAAFHNGHLVVAGGRQTESIERNMCLNDIQALDLSNPEEGWFEVAAFEAVPEFRDYVNGEWHLVPTNSQLLAFPCNTALFGTTVPVFVIDIVARTATKCPPFKLSSTFFICDSIVSFSCL